MFRVAYVPPARRGDEGAVLVHPARGVARTGTSLNARSRVDAMHAAA